MPTRGVEAGILSSLSSMFVGDPVYAQSDPNIIKPPQPGSNSQNIALLQANVSSASVLEDKSINKDEVLDMITIDTTNSIISDNALLPSLAGFVGADGMDANTDVSFEDISVYVVRKGDSLSQIADMFEVSVNTILWANDMKKGDKLVEGDTLFILPVSGLKHVVTKGQTLKSIAQKYNADIGDIVSFNGITEDTKLVIGDELIIPGGEMSVDGPVKTTTAKGVVATAKTSLKSIAGYFINPVLGAIKTQGLHGKNAVDLAAPIGTPIRAAASGTVLLARMGWNGAYGNMVIIQHPNGTKTLYSHLSKIASTTGQSVSQGDTIGYVGNSGRVRAAKGGNGAHLHFEVYNAKNPGADRSWKQ
ncbi:MAG: peptidoglycan DD-metalloendopeptidase family protein [Minisyncoccia bacterium]